MCQDCVMPAKRPTLVTNREELHSFRGHLNWLSNALG